MNFWDIPAIRVHNVSFDTWQMDIDPEKSIHSPDLFSIWNGKSWLLNHSASLNLFSSKYHFWIDAGSFRQFDSRKPLRRWPNSKFVDTIFCGRENRLLFGLPMQVPQLFHDYWQGRVSQLPKYDSKSAFCVEGTFFGGTVDAVSQWTQTYYNLLRELIDSRIFVGDDQFVMTKLLVKHPQTMIAIESYKVGDFFDQWFYFQQFLATAEEMKANPPRKSLLIPYSQTA
jgi:hypothetical protein